MTHDVVMPQLGLTMTEGSVSVWFKTARDKIEKGEVLFSVETDKSRWNSRGDGIGNMWRQRLWRQNKWWRRVR